MQTHLSLPYEQSDALPECVLDDIRTPRPLVEHYVEAFTDPGDVVFDPFAGFGTTLVVAEDLGRVPCGVEYELDRAAFVRGRLERDEHVLHDDALELSPDDLPAADLCFTSPPFMTAEMELNPFENYDGESSYEAYLDDLRTAFEHAGECMAPDSRVVLDVCNVKNEGRVTPLAWDVGEAVAEVFDFRGEVVVTWEVEGDHDRRGDFGYGYDHNYCLVYEV